jgi:mono/diheme cytochrome c family protein
VRTLWISGTCLLITLAWAGYRSPVERAPAKAAKLINPFEGNENARLAGGKLFARECAPCHGKNRQGRGRAPSLNQAEVREGPPGILFWVLRNGSLSRGMPSFAHLPEQQRWQIITFLHSAAQP